LGSGGYHAKAAGRVGRSDASKVSRGGGGVVGLGGTCVLGEGLIVLAFRESWSVMDCRDVAAPQMRSSEALLGLLARPGGAVGNMQAGRS
jgi:hypothetical protein